MAKAWRKEAAKIKKAAIKNGTHIKGARYGKVAKATVSEKLLAYPSTLFQILCLNVGIWKLRTEIHGTNTGRLTSTTPHYAELPRGESKSWLRRAFNKLFSKG